MVTVRKVGGFSAPLLQITDVFRLAYYKYFKLNRGSSTTFQSNSLGLLAISIQKIRSLDDLTVVSTVLPTTMISNGNVATFENAEEGFYRAWFLTRMDGSYPITYQTDAF